MARARRGIRIIGGQWRGSRLPIADSNAIRPTPDRVRETLFNWLRDDVSGARCLDLFAGSGALGLEAASRGAAHVVLLERDRNAFLTLEQSCERLHAATVEPVMAGALEWLENADQRERLEVIPVAPLEAPEHRSLIDSLLRNLDMKLVSDNMPVMFVLKATEQLTSDSKRRRHDAAGIAGMHTFLQDIDC